jgi:vacuolar-type H+-ATPase subunit E/Vma4
MNDSESKLQRELLDDAAQQAELALSQARAAAAAALAAVRDEVSKVRVQRLAEVQQEAKLRERAIAAGVRHELQRRWLVLREEGLERLFAEVLPRLESGADIAGERSLRQLLQEALEALGPRAVNVRLNPAAAAFLSAAAIAEVAALAWGQAGAAVSVNRVVDASLRPGLRVESTDGRLVFDNTYALRLERLRRPLRSLASAGLASAESDDDSHA